MIPGQIRPVLSICIALSLLLLIAACVPPASAIMPVANFTSNVTMGVIPFEVSFTDTSTGLPTSWNWSFGDGALSTLNNSVHRYTVAGIYTVSLTATNAEGNSTWIIADYIIAETVKAGFTANTTSGIAPLAVQFTDISINSPLSWNWSFGDSSYSSAQHPIHTYTNAGRYNVTLVANNTYGSDQNVKTQYITVASGGTTNSTDIPGVSLVPAPSYTLEPRLNKSSLMSGSNLTVNGNSATITNPSPFFSSAVFEYFTLTDVAGNIWGDKIRSVQLNTTPLFSNLAGVGPTTVFMTLNLGQYTLGNTLSILMLDMPSASDTAAFYAVAGSTRPLRALSYEIDISSSSSPFPYPDLNNADIYFTVPLSWATTYGTDNIRLFRISGSPEVASVLPASLYSSDSTTATYRATTTGFSRFSPGAISPVFTPTPTLLPTTIPTPTLFPAPAPPVGNGGDSSDSGGGTGIAALPEQPKMVVVPKVEPPLEIPIQMEPDAPQDKPAAPAVSKPGVPAPAAPGSPATSQDGSDSFTGTVISALQDGGARAAGFVTGDRGPLPADSILPPRAQPLGAVAAGIAMAGAVALAGSTGATASGGLLGTLFGQILSFFQHLFKPVTDFFSDRLAGHAEDHASELLERQDNPISRSLDAARNPLLPHTSQILMLGCGAALYGLAFVVAERAGMLPVVIGTYILVSGVVVLLHELAHYFVARKFVMKSELKFSTTGLVMTFFSAWFFGNVFSQPLTTKIPDDTREGKKTLGIAMLAGPLVSLACAAVFALLIPIGGIWTMIGTTGLAINLVQIVFSLIPVKPLDGQPVFTWNRLAWAAVFIPVFAIYLLVYLL